MTSRAMSQVHPPLVAVSVSAPPRPRPSDSLMVGAAAHLLGDRVTVLALLVLVVFGALAILAPWIANTLGISTTDVNLAVRFQPPSAAHLLGTDDFGRDQLARLLAGARVSLSVGFLAALVNLTVGLGLGLAAAQYGGRVDDAVSWLINTLRSIPGLFLVLIVASLFQVDAVGLALVIGLTSWMLPARIVRGTGLELRERDYVLAARACGATQMRILLRHLLPNVFSLALVLLGIDVAEAILRESSLSYLGLGIQPPNASWGNMLSNAQTYFVRAPWLVFTPGAVIAVTVWSLFAVGDGLRDALDPRTIRTRRRTRAGNP